jgi:serine/threonine-protein kinase
MDELLGAAVGRYEIERVLSSYVTDSVYVARDPTLNRPVLLKIQNEIDGHAIGEALVRNEAQILAQLSHPGIQRIHDMGRHIDGRYYIVVEYLAGGRLKDVLRAGATGVDALVQSIAGAAECSDTPTDGVRPPK